MSKMTIRKRMAPAERVIEVRGTTIRYDVRRLARARHIRLAVYPGGTLRVTLPLYISENVVERFIREKAQWVIEKIAELKEYVVPVTSRPDIREYRRRKEEALAFIMERVVFWNQRYGFLYGRISVRNQKTRWGSCSKKGNLNFSYRLLFLPRAMADYVVVHELCHLQEFNHSERFWSLVERSIPEYRDIVREMKKL